MHDYIQGYIHEINELSPRVKQIKWKPKVDRLYPFVPGQFSIIHFPKINGNMPYRSYSIAGVQEGNIVEFCISYKEGGAATALLWEMKEGDLLEITEAKGEFTLREPFAKRIIFIATGTGIAPFKPMITELLKQSHANIDLVYGNRYLEDILYHDFWNTLERETAQFNYHPILSREIIENRKGYVHEIYPHLIDSDEKTQFYICGWNQMIKETRKNLKAMGYSRKEYFIESYD